MRNSDFKIVSQNSVSVRSYFRETVQIDFSQLSAFNTSYISFNNFQMKNYHRITTSTEKNNLKSISWSGILF